MGGGAWKAAVHGVAKSQAQQSDFTFTFHFHALEKEMAAHSSVLAWRIPGTGELGGLPSMGSHRVGHDWSDLAAAAVYICQRYFLNLSHLLLPHRVHKSLLCLRLSFFSVNRFISTGFLDSIYMHGYTIFIFLFLKKGALEAQETCFFLPLRWVGK